ncbi:MAG: hypothetical protein AAF827_16640 [Cyanobacteria bacterium P01_D01_bin.6]
MRIPLVLLHAVILAPILSTGYSSAAHADSTDNDAHQSASEQDLFQPYFIDFETALIDGIEVTLEAGAEIVGDEWADYGVQITVDSTRSHRKDRNRSLPMRLYDSDCRRPNEDLPLPICTGGDFDLATGEQYGTAPQGNVLIIQERGKEALNQAPDDDARGGKITFTFKEAVQTISLGFLDFDDQDRGEGFIRFYEEEDDNNAAFTFKLSEVTAINGLQGDNSIRVFQEMGEAFTKLEVEYPGSGAITHLCFDAEVAPGGSENWGDVPEACGW